MDKTILVTNFFKKIIMENIRKQFTLLWVFMLFCIYSFAQQQTFKEVERFDSVSTIKFVATPSNGWKLNSNYFQSPPNSYRAVVPNMFGDSIILQTPTYYFSGMNYVLMRFNHICKVSPRDIVRIEYRITGQTWLPIPSTNVYMGGALSYNVNNAFNAGSYTQWQADDSTAIPTSSWWREELYDLSHVVGLSNTAEFRFILKRGTTQGTQVSYGWLIDDFEITAAPYLLSLPIVEFISPLVKDTVYNTGPWTINAKVKTTTTAPIENPYLKWSSNNWATYDSVRMEKVGKGDSLWRATIPQYVAGTKVSYSVIGRDTTGNEKTIWSEYVIKRACSGISVVGKTTIGNGTSSQTVIPLNTGNSYSYTQQLYLASEMGRSGMIGAFAFDVATVGSAPQILDIYMGHTSQTTIAAAANTIPHSALTLVYSGTHAFSATGWSVITLQTPFFYNGTDNIVVAVHKKTGASMTGAWYCQSPAPNSAIRYFSATAATVDPAIGLTATSSVGTIRPNIEFYYGAGGGSCDDSNSVALLSIDMSDTVITSPTTQFPIIATIKNKGIADLSSVIVSYSINGGSAVSKTLHLNPSLPWDFNYQDTIGYNIFTPNKVDTVTVWVSYPNGAVDSVTTDDTLTKRIYGRADIAAEFVTNPTDTVYSTGPHRVTAKIITLSGTPISAVSLYIEYIEHALSSVTKYDTLTMQQNGNLWTVEIPNIHFESDVMYSIKLTDKLGNLIQLSDNFYIKYLYCLSANDMRAMDFLYTGSIQTKTLQPGQYQLECWGANGANGLVSGGIGGYSRGTIIVSSPQTYYIYVGGIGLTGAPGAGGWNGGGNGGLYSTNSSAGGGGGTDIRTTQNTSYSNRIIAAGGGGGGASGGTTTGIGGNGGGVTGMDGLPYSTTYPTTNGLGGTLSAGGAGGTYTTTTPNGFDGVLGRGGNGGNGSDAYLGGGGGGGYYGGGGGASYYGAGGAGGSGYIGGVANGITVQPTDPLFVANSATTGHGFVRITPTSIAGDCLENSVAMDAILSPKERSDAGVNIPILVRIRNKGTNDLDSCYINWTLNGVLQPQTPYHVYRNASGLPEDFTDTVTIGDYTPTLSATDAIVAWVSMPNGVIDSITYDDTLKIISLGCGATFAGDITVGAGKDFPTINAALEAMRDCGVGGDIRLLLASGTYTTAWNFTNSAWNGINFGTIMGSYMLTFASETNNPDDVILRLTSGTAAIVLNNTRNLTIKAIKVDVSTLTIPAIQFTGACTNIIIRDCKLLGNTTTTTSSTTNAPVSKVTSTGVVDSIFFINNLIDGGYYGWYFYGGTGSTAFGTNVVFDSNTVSNQYYYGTYPYYVDFNSCSYNTVLSRTANTTTSWYGLRIYYSNAEKVIGNRIIQRSTAITSPYGVYIYYANYYNAPQQAKTMLFANNEIIIYTTGVYYGIYEYYSATQAPIHYLHNSIYVGGAGNAYGIDFAATVQSNSYRVVKNNNIYTAGTSSYPIYLGTAFNATMYDIDYNNMYAPTNVGYSGGARTTITDWQNIVTTDQNSVRVQPNFVNSSVNLKMTSSAGLLCAGVGVANDIDNATRGVLATMGCYEMLMPAPLNATLTEISGLKGGNVQGQTDQVKVTVLNSGLTTHLDSVNIELSINGVSVKQGGTYYPVSLATGQSATITLGPINYIPGNANVKVWINRVNNNLIDGYQNDDTLSQTVTICVGSYSGVITIGASPSNDFQTVQQVYDALALCTVSGDITFAFESGTYTESINLSNNSTLFGTYHLTITSQTGDAKDVIFTPLSGNNGITLGSTNNVTIKAITIDVSTQTVPAIQFTGACTNILVRDCRLLGNPTTATNATTNAPISKGTTGVVNTVSFINNEINGGYYGVYFSGGTGTAAYGSRIVFDSNTVTNARCTTAYFQYTDFLSCSYNLIKNRTSDAHPGGSAWDSVWFGLYVNYVNGPIIGNRVSSNTTTSRPCGMRIGYYHNYLTTDTGLVANNEFRINSSSNHSNFGIYVLWSSKAKIINNSIYSRNGYPYGIYLNQPSSTHLIVQNNHIDLLGGGLANINATYAIYYTDSNYLNQYDFDYNNYLSRWYIGSYKGTTHSSLANWRGAILQDSNSTGSSGIPSAGYVGISNSLEFDATTFNGANYRCPVKQEVMYDINGNFRMGNTTKGAYERPYPAGYYDLWAERIPQTEKDVVYNQQIPINVDVWNVGGVLDSATFGWSLNGTIQQTGIPYIFTPPLATNEKQNVIIDVYTVTENPGDTLNIVVWVENVNGVPDTILWNNTPESISYFVQPLAEFVNILPDTIFSASFSVNAIIRDYTGAPTTTPEVYIYSVGPCLVLYDTVKMQYNTNKGTWVADIPAQYYGSKVVYEVHISDTVTPPNSIILKDSTFLQFGSGIGGGNGDDYFYTGSVQPITLRPGTYQIECWGADGGGTTQYPGGKGGYSKGTITLKSPTSIYIYVGEGNRVDGTSRIRTFGGGGWGYSSTPTRGAGGGASDVRVLVDDLYNRVIVAGGGGGSLTNSTTGNPTTAHGGGLIGGNGGTVTTGGTQTAGGISSSYLTEPTMQGTFGIGGNGNNGNTLTLCGGGGGWYGGGGGNPGAGGSGYVLTSSSLKPVGYFAANANYYLTDDATIRYNELGFISNPDTTGNGFVRITKIGGGGEYKGNHLSLTEVISPVNTEELCEKPHVPFTVLLMNLGENDYDFSINNITIEYEIKISSGLTYNGNKSINTGELPSGETEEITLIDSLLLTSGTYAIKAWVNSSIDVYHCDDTITAAYISNKIGLPIDEYFAATDLPFEFITTPVLGTSIWEVYPQDINYPVQPDSVGTNILRFTGTRGAMAQLKTRQIDLHGTVSPKAEFWYHHDPTLPELDNSYMEVYVVVNGDRIKKWELFKRNDTVTQTWTKYTIDLEPYTTEECVYIEFESMVGEAQSAQYIDRIHITSNQDLEVFKIYILPEITSACNLKNRDVYVVIHTPMAQSIDLSTYQAKIALEIPGYPTFDVPLTKNMAGNSSDTFLLASGINFVNGTTAMKAYLTAPVDDYPLNDTLTALVEINPEITVTAQSISRDTNCPLMNAPVRQYITVKNIGNTGVSDIKVLLQTDYLQQVSGSLPGIIPPGDSATVFVDYTTPNNVSSYKVKITAYTDCDSTLANAEITLSECVDINDLSVISIDKPDGQFDVSGTYIDITVTLKNLSDSKDYKDVKIFADIDASGHFTILKDTVAIVPRSSTQSFTFKEQYLVPEDEEYTITVFVENMDNYPIKDTARTKRFTKPNAVIERDANGFVLYQNVPNPTDNSNITGIAYRIPASGEVILSIYNKLGQLLYSQTLQSEAGKHVIELNTSGFAAGVYLYSMEYKGQKLVKRMSVKK